MLFLSYASRQRDRQTGKLITIHEVGVNNSTQPDVTDVGVSISYVRINMSN